ncbi:MAG: MerR family transcriptional regulator [Ignavibacteriales bacterium]|nr:MerR family transcriptional regulator [Ignavibacteriales bacterium]
MKEIDIAKEEPIFPISAAAKLLKISVHTIRMYEREGLFVPFKKESNQRLFSKDDIERIECIRGAINELKISINGIKTIYSLIPCWEIIHCSERDRKKCSAFNSHNQACWAEIHKGTICEKRGCRDCEVYKNYSECGKVKELIKSYAVK